MKLSKAQLKALEAVEDGSVSIYKPLHISKPQKLCGIHKKTYEKLIDAGLVTSRYVDLVCNAVLLTTEGRKALEDARNAD